MDHNLIHGKFIIRISIRKLTLGTSSMDAESNPWEIRVGFSDKSPALRKNLADAYGFFTNGQNSDNPRLPMKIQIRKINLHDR